MCSNRYRISIAFNYWDTWLFCILFSYKWPHCYHSSVMNVLESELTCAAGVNGEGWGAGREKWRRRERKEREDWTISFPLTTPLRTCTAPQPRHDIRLTQLFIAVLTLYFWNSFYYASICLNKYSMFLFLFLRRLYISMIFVLFFFPLHTVEASRTVSGLLREWSPKGASSSITDEYWAVLRRGVCG